MTIQNLYQMISKCKERCDGIINDPKSGNMPRGYWYFGESEQCKLIVVGKNPGHPLGIETTGVYNCDDSYAKYIELLNGRYLRNEMSTPFHVRLLEYINFITETNGFNEAIKKVAFTNLVKCTTIGEQDKLKKMTMLKCGCNWLIKELNELKCKNILCLGNEAFDGVKLVLGIKAGEFSIQKIKHPSYPIKKEDKIITLESIKKNLL